MGMEIKGSARAITPMSETKHKGRKAGLSFYAIPSLSAKVVAVDIALLLVLADVTDLSVPRIAEILFAQGVLGAVVYMLHRDWKMRGTKIDSLQERLLKQQREVLEANTAQREALDRLTQAINTRRGA